jgi:peptide/nickel transport system permease protein
VLSGDLGNSVLTARPVLDDILAYFPATLELATVAIVIGVLVGRPGGRARRHPPGPLAGPGRPGAEPARVLDPVFWLGLMGLLLFYAKLGWVAGPGRLDVPTTT